jgi:predicted PurR-regulated permease PerM
VTIPKKLTSANLVTFAIIVGGLFFTREILVPIALAILLSFVLAPLVRALQRIGLPRPLAVICAVMSAMIVALSLAAMVVFQVNQLSADLPRYQATLGKKVHVIREKMGSAGLLVNASSLLKNLSKELDTPEIEKPKTPTSLSPTAAPNKPIPVEVHQPDPGASETLVAVLQPLVTPFTTTGIVLIFVIFFLLQREDLRNRFIRLAGGDLERTTSALDDAAHRLGSLFVTQLILNAIFGAIIGTGLAIIGVPSAPLWGLLAMILRFVPYIGALLAAVLPLALAAAVGQDWSMVLWTASMFAIIEPIMGYLLEPLICGKSAGLSPVAVVIAASFWTWLWGPLGLLLSTPLTLCLVVMARHVDRLQFIDVMLGDQPALTPQQAAYQRMLAADPLEAIEQSRAYLKEGSVLQYYDDVLLGALRLAQADASLGRLDDARLANIVQTVNEVVEDLGHTDIEKELSQNRTDDHGANTLSFSSEQSSGQVLCRPGLGRLDECAVVVTTDLLKRAGITAYTGASSDIRADEVNSICICYLEDISEARIGYASRKLSRQSPSAKIVFALLGQNGTPIAMEGGAQTIVHTLKELSALFANPPMPRDVIKRPTLPPSLHH